MNLYNIWVSLSEMSEKKKYFLDVPVVHPKITIVLI